MISYEHKTLIKVNYKCVSTTSLALRWGGGTMCLDLRRKQISKGNKDIQGVNSILLRIWLRRHMMDETRPAAGPVRILNASLISSHPNPQAVESHHYSRILFTHLVSQRI